jgi:hypothetical protein
MVEETQDPVEFQLDRSNLYLEETFTDLTVGSVKRFTPVTPDGSPDKTRKTVFVGQTNVQTPHGPLPVQNMIRAKELPQAFKRFPEAMEEAVRQLIAEARKMSEDKQPPVIQTPDSRIILP